MLLRNSWFEAAQLQIFRFHREGKVYGRHIGS